MPGYFDPFSGIWWGYNVGEDGWGAATNNSLRNIAYRGIHKNIKGTVSSPPSSPSLGDTYIVGANPSGWVGITPAQHQLVVYGRDAVTPTTISWFVIQPRVGMPAFDLSRNEPIRYRDGVWKEEEPTINKPIISDSTITGDGVSTPLSVVFPPQVQSDWNATGTTNPARIKNKPTIPPVVNNNLWVGDSFTINGTVSATSSSRKVYRNFTVAASSRIKLSSQVIYAAGLGNTQANSGTELRIGYGVYMRVSDLQRSSTVQITSSAGGGSTELAGVGNGNSYQRGAWGEISGYSTSFSIIARVGVVGGTRDQFTLSGQWYAGLLISG